MVVVVEGGTLRSNLQMADSPPILVPTIVNSVATTGKARPAIPTDLSAMIIRQTKIVKSLATVSRTLVASRIRYRRVKSLLLVGLVMYVLVQIVLTTR